MLVVAEIGNNHEAMSGWPRNSSASSAGRRPGGEFRRSRRSVWSAPTTHASPSCGARQPCVILGRQREAPQLGEACRLVGADQTLGHDGLEFHRLGAGHGCEADEFLGQPDIALMVVADLGDHQHLVIEVDGPILMRRPSTGKERRGRDDAARTAPRRDGSRATRKSHGRRIGRLVFRPGNRAAGAGRRRR